MTTTHEQVAGTVGGESESNEVLHRILVAVERDRRRGRLELVVAIILSLATLSSTWCGYQASQWGGVQSTSQIAADTAERQAAENTILGLQLRTQDGLTMLEFWRVLRAGDTKTSENIRAHMRPVARTALDAAIAAGVLTNPEVPGPLQRAEYALPEERKAADDREQAGKLRATAASAGDRAGQYVLLTLMFASVLFFGGIASTFTERRVRVGLAVIALAIFMFTAAKLVILLPSSHQPSTSPTAPSVGTSTQAAAETRSDGTPSSTAR